MPVLWSWRVPDHKAGAEARMLAIFGQAKGKPRPTRRTVEYADTGFGLLCKATEEAWVKSRKLNERERWDKVCELLDGANQEFCWRVAGRVMRKELERARWHYQQCRNVTSEPFKAELIGASGRHMREMVEQVDACVVDLMQYLEPVGDLVSRLNSRMTAAGLNRRQVRTLLSPGTWTAAAQGAARGKGIPGYDSAQGVETARQLAASAHRQHQKRQAEASAKRAARGSKAKRKGKVAPSATGLLQQD